MQLTNFVQAVYKVKRHLINVRIQQDRIITVVGYMIILQIWCMNASLDG